MHHCLWAKFLVIGIQIILITLDIMEYTTGQTQTETSRVIQIQIIVEI